MNQRTQRLIDIMKDSGLSAKDVAELLGKSEKTVRIWRCKNEDRVIPQNLLDLLILKLAAKAA
ncbi:MAG TPA: helix-turn-helix domain-containing protein [Abditibacteriaceae bacterium]|jgi:transposase